MLVSGRVYPWNYYHFLMGNPWKNRVKSLVCVSNRDHKSTGLYHWKEQYVVEWSFTVANQKWNSYNKLLVKALVGKSLSHDSFSISDLKCDPKPIRIQPISKNYHRPILVSAIFFCGHSQARLLHHIEKQPSINIKINLFQKKVQRSLYYQLYTNYQNINMFKSGNPSNLRHLHSLIHPRNHGMIGIKATTGPNIAGAHLHEYGLHNQKSAPCGSRWNFDVVG